MRLGRISRYGLNRTRKAFCIDICFDSTGFRHTNIFRSRPTTFVLPSCRSPYAICPLIPSK